MKTFKKILHVNDIASVGSSLVKGLNQQGLECEMVNLRKPLARYPLILKIFGSGLRFIEARRTIRYAKANGFEALHIHYLSSAVWFWFSGLPMIVHVHGTDARFSYLYLPRHITNWISCRMAKLVLFSTPDLEPYVKRYIPDPVFLPNPIDADLFKPQDLPRKPKRIFLFSALNPIKGADRAIEALGRVKAAHPSYDIVGLQLGDFQKNARRAGVDLYELIPRSQLPPFLAEAGLILGQFKVGSIGMSELEVLALGRTILCHLKYRSIYPEQPPFVECETPEQIEKAVLAYIENSAVYDDLDARAREWVIKYHGLANVSKKLIELYSERVFTKTPIIALFAPGKASWIGLDCQILSQFGRLRFNDVLDMKPNLIARNLISVFSADLCYFWFGSFRHLPYLLLAKFLRRKIVVVAGGYDANGVESIGYGQFRSNRARRFVFELADKVLAVSTLTRNSAIERVGLSPQKIEVISLGFPQRLEEISPWTSRLPQVVFLLSAKRDSLLVKGVDRIPQICRALPEIKFVLAGSLSPEVEKFVRSQDLQNLELTGYLEYQGAKFRQVLNESRVICMPSRMESFGAAAFDGASYGCVPVAFAVGALPEVLEGIGELVPDGDIKGLVSAIDRTVRLPQVDVMKLRNLSNERFSLERRALALSEVIHALEQR